MKKNNNEIDLFWNKVAPARKILKEVHWWISQYNDILDKDTCKMLIDYDWDWQPSTFSNNKGTAEKSEERVLMDQVWCVEKDEPYSILKKSVIKVMNMYAKEHKRFSCIHHTDFRINKYGVDGFMSKHCDNIHHSHGQKYGYPQATVLFFLNNDEYEGGELVIGEDEKIKYKPLTGSVFVFPSSFMFPHEVKKVTKGERVSIVSWLM